MFMPLLLLIFLLPSTLSRPPAIATSDVPTAYTPLPFPYLSLLGLFFAICGSNQAAEAAQRSISFAASLRASRLISRAAPLFPAMPAVPVRLLLLVPVRAKITVNVRPSPLRLQFLLAFNISSKLPAIKMRQMPVVSTTTNANSTARFIPSNFVWFHLNGRNFQTHLVPFPPAYEVVPQVTPRPQRKAQRSTIAKPILSLASRCQINLNIET
ncbi:hypothetical protein C8F04DRAFT_1198346 [Mycena alexandri]|uniref:Secreted protein n=1 Tax=Mycena alexandri TaxID=1745969 RepID=A0AAD6WS38_9AGAR|nr:hypothetical protein C8F04DRAFT_1198346 [Mycena alexandri]